MHRDTKNGTWYTQEHRDMEHTFTNRRQNEHTTLNITIALHYPSPLDSQCRKQSLLAVSSTIYRYVSSYKITLYPDCWDNKNLDLKQLTCCFKCTYRDIIYMKVRTRRHNEQARTDTNILQNHCMHWMLRRYKF